jgi:hypothetical protein
VGIGGGEKRPNKTLSRLSGNLTFLLRNERGGRDRIDYGPPVTRITRLRNLRRETLGVGPSDALRRFCSFRLRIPTKPAMHSKLKPATYSSFIPASIPI